MPGKSFVTLDPTEQPIGSATRLARRPASLAGMRLGLFSNGKPNGDRLLDHLAELIAARYPLAEVVRGGKPRSSVLAEPEALDQMARRCDLFVTAIGD